MPDEGGMAIRVDPRRLGLLKELAAAADLRPGQLVQRWVEERLDAERSGGTVAAPSGGAGRLDSIEASLAELTARVAALSARVAAAQSPAAAKPEPTPTETGAARQALAPQTPSTAPAAAAAAAPKRRGRPRRTAASTTSARTATGRRRRSAAAPTAERVPLHEEIVEVIRERGPSTAAELAAAIGERGRYHAPRSSRALDAATVNSRVSNPVYRGRFTRANGRIGLAD